MTVPNIISIMRLLLVPCVIYALLESATGWAFAGFILAGVSDGVDGFIARHFDQRSELGAYLDPMADKLLLVSVFVVLGLMGQLPLWLVVLAVSRDVLIVLAVLLSTVMHHPVHVRPLFVSKVNTTVQIVVAGLALARLSVWPAVDTLMPFLIAVSGILTVASAAAYLVAWLKHMGGAREGESSSR